MNRSEQMNNEELMHYGVKGQKWGVRKDAKRIGRTLNKLDRKFARETAVYMQTNDKKSKSAQSKNEASKKAMSDIESKQWKLIGEAYSKNYNVLSKDKIRDGRSFARKLAMAGALTTSIDGFYNIKKYGDKYPGTYNGRQFNQNPMTIQGKQFKVKAY